MPITHLKALLLGEMSFGVQGRRLSHLLKHLRLPVVVLVRVLVVVLVVVWVVLMVLVKVVLVVALTLVVLVVVVLGRGRVWLACGQG